MTQILDDYQGSHSLSARRCHTCDGERWDSYYRSAVSAPRGGHGLHYSIVPGKAQSGRAPAGRAMTRECGLAFVGRLRRRRSVLRQRELLIRPGCGRVRFRTRRHEGHGVRRQRPEPDPAVKADASEAVTDRIRKSRRRRDRPSNYDRRSFEFPHREQPPPHRPFAPTQDAGTTGPPSKREAPL